MSDVAIRVNHLSKEFRIGKSRGKFRYKSLRDSVSSAMMAPLRRAAGMVRGNAYATSDLEESFWALKDVSFEVKQGEAVGVIGRNGAGKSTLLKILSEITEPSEGTVELHGRVGSLLEVGTGFHPELTGRDNIYLNGAILGMKRAEINRKFDEIVDFAEVEKFIDTPVKHYSSGMYVRLAFAVAAHLEPEILVVDEVLAVGDAAFQKKCLGKMGDVAKGGRTVLFVSHDLAAIESFCQRVVVLQSGQLAFDDTKDKAIASYLKSLQVTSSGSLVERKDRQGSGEMRAIEVQIFNEKGDLTNYIQMGGSFHVRVRSRGKVAKAVIGILFGNAGRKQIVRGYTWEQVAHDIDLTGEENTIDCMFQNFPMMHGTYDVHLWMGQNNNLMDYIENVAEINIIPTDIFGTGRALDPRGGLAFCKASWKINGVLYD